MKLRVVLRQSRVRCNFQFSMAISNEGTPAITSPRTCKQAVRVALRTFLPFVCRRTEATDLVGRCSESSISGRLATHTAKVWRRLVRAFERDQAGSSSEDLQIEHAFPAGAAESR